MARALRLVVPALWMGIVIALAFIETPLKFLAPGMTLDVALGLGRIVLTAENIASGILLLVLTMAAFLGRHRPVKVQTAFLITLWVVVIVQIAVVRPLLNARSDIRVAGGDPGESPLHLIYILTDLVLIAMLLCWIVVESRVQRVIPAATP